MIAATAIGIVVGGGCGVAVVVLEWMPLVCFFGTEVVVFVGVDVAVAAAITQQSSMTACS